MTVFDEKTLCQVSFMPMPKKKPDPFLIQLEILLKLLEARISFGSNSSEFSFKGVVFKYSTHSSQNSGSPGQVAGNKYPYFIKLISTITILVF